MASRVLFIVLGLLALCFAVEKRCAGNKRCSTPGEYIDDSVPLLEVEHVSPRIGAAAVLASTPLGQEDDGGYAYIIGGSFITSLGLYLLPDRVPGYPNPLFTSEVNVYSFAQKKFVAAPADHSSTGEWSELTFPRSFHVAAAWGGFIWVWGGGSSEIERYDIENEQWDVIAVNGPKPVSRYGSAGTVVGDTWYIFGGIQDAAPSADFVTNELWAFDFETLSWSAVEYIGLAPEPRVAPSLNYYRYENGEEVLVVFGGWNYTTEVYNSLWFFDLSSNTWTHHNATFQPEFRLGMAAVVVEDKLYITAGSVLDPSFSVETWRSIWSFDFEDEEWTKFEKKHYQTSQSPREGFSYVFYNGQFAFFSGWSMTGLDTGGLVPDVFFSTIDSDSKWSWRFQCYPGYRYVDNTCQAWRPHDYCETCKDCADFSEQRRTYAAGIRGKLIDGDYTGYLRQCPAFWRQNIGYPIQSTN